MKKAGQSRKSLAVDQGEKPCREESGGGESLPPVCLLWAGCFVFILQIILRNRLWSRGCCAHFTDVGTEAQASEAPCSGSAKPKPSGLSPPPSLLSLPVSYPTPYPRLAAFWGKHQLPSSFPPALALDAVRLGRLSSAVTLPMAAFSLAQTSHPWPPPGVTACPLPAPQSVGPSWVSAVSIAWT